MAITYSYPKQSSVYGSDIILINRDLITYNINVDSLSSYLATSILPESNNYGLASGYSDSIEISETAVPRSLLPIDYKGSLTVPANTFVKGDAFRLCMMGSISSNNNVPVKVFLKTTSGVTLAESSEIVMSSATNKHWTLEFCFTIRSIGEVGSASIMSGGNFSYAKDAGNNMEAFNFEYLNQTDFDTTVENSLEVLFQWGEASGNNSITTKLFNLYKIY